LFSCQPTIGKEVVDLRSLGGWKSGQNIFEIFAGIDVEALASLNQAHDCGSGLASFFGTGEQPVFSTDDHRFDVAFATVVADFDEGMIEVNEQSRPAIEGVRNGFTELCLGWLEKSCFVKPFFQHCDLGLGQPLAQIHTFRRWQGFCKSFDVKETLDEAHGKFCRLRVSFPGIFEVTVHVRPAVGSSGPIGNDLVELVGTVCLKNASKAFENSFWIERVLRIRVVVKNVGIVSVSAVDPYISFMSFAESFLDDRKGGGIRLNDPGVQNELSHSSNNRTDKCSNFLQPPAHGRAINRDAQRLEHLFLAVKGQVKPEFIGCDFGEESRTGQPLIDRLVGLWGSNDLSIAFLASVLKCDVLDCFEESLDELDLVGDIKTDDFAHLPAARTRELAFTDAVFFFASTQVRRRCGASTALIALRQDVQSLLFGIELVGGLAVNDQACAGQKGGVDFGRLLTEGLAVTATELFFEFGDAGKEFFDEFVTIFEIVGQFWRIIGTELGRLFRHGFYLCPD
jgi:hypothetical protein